MCSDSHHENWPIERRKKCECEKSHANVTTLWHGMASNAVLPDINCEHTSSPYYHHQRRRYISILYWHQTLPMFYSIWQL